MPRRRKPISGKKRLNVAKEYGWKCRYCKRKLRVGNPDHGKALEIDHKRPVSRDGSNKRRNLQATCKRCNREKGGKTHKQYMRWLEDNNLLVVDDEDEDEYEDEEDELIDEWDPEDDWDDEDDDNTWL